MTMDERHREEDARLEEEGWMQLEDAVVNAKNLLLESIRDRYPGDGAVAKSGRCLSFVKHMNILYQAAEVEYGETFPNEVVAEIIEEVFKLSKRKGWNE